MKTRTLTHDDIPDTYAELVGVFMPRPLHDDVDYRNALVGKGKEGKEEKGSGAFFVQIIRNSVISQSTC